MIKALYLESYPEMDKVSAIEILDELDPIIKNENNSTVLVGSNHKIYKDAFITPNYYVTFIKIDESLTFMSIKKIYEILQLSIPNFLKVLNIKNTLIVATPRYNDVYENASYSVMMDELVRFTSYAYRKTGCDDISTSIMLKEYVEMCVSYPGNRMNTYKGNEGK